MKIEVIRSAFAWCAVINLGLLLLWFLVFALAHDRVYRLHSRWFHIPVDRFDAMHCAGMALFKIGLFLFNLAPYFALRIIG